MARAGAQSPLGHPPGVPRAAVAIDRLADCVRSLDPASRALLDLSLRRRIGDDAVAPAARAAARAAAAAHPTTVRAAARGAFFACAGAVLGRAFSRRRR